MSHLGKGNIFGGTGAPQSWKSQENKFCPYCKCWVADNPVSKNFHEQGQRHTKAFEEHLIQMRKDTHKKQKSEAFESKALREMEEAALEDYKEKDVATSRDFTAKLYNNEQGLPGLEGVQYEAAEEVEYEAGTSKPGQIGPAKPKKVTISKEARLRKEQVKNNVDPMKEVTGDCPDKWDKDFEEKMDEIKKGPLELRPVITPKTGTPWQKNEGQPKMFYEALDDDGNSYYYHIKSGESRWDAPPWGFMSIAEQKEIEKKQLTKEYNKVKTVVEQREIHGELRKAEIMHKEMPDMSAKDPYGKGGWSLSSEPQPAEDALPHLGLPAKWQKMQRVIDPTEDTRLVIKEKTLPPGQLDGYGLVPLPDQVATVEKTTVVTQPKISFRKRKAQSLREREEED